MSNPSTTRFVRIDWEDTAFDDNWNEEDGNENAVMPKECTNWGYLIEETPTLYRLASGYCWPDETWATIHAISKMQPRISTVWDLSPSPDPDHLLAKPNPSSE